MEYKQLKSVEFLERLDIEGVFSLLGVFLRLSMTHALKKTRRWCEVNNC